MRFNENTIRPSRHCGACQHGRILSIPAGLIAATTGHLHRMRGIENHRPAKLPHDRHGTHVRHQIVVAEGRPAVGYKQHLPSSRFGLLHHLPHFLWRKELAFFQIYNHRGARGHLDQICLATEKRRNLDHVHHLRCSACLRFVMNIRQHRHIHFFADGFQNLQPLFQSRPPATFTGSAVRLIIAGFKNIGNPQPLACFPQ